MNTYRLSLLVLIAIAPGASAQLISVGVKGGVPLIDQSKGNDESRPYLVGPTIEVRLPAGFAIEVDGLYQRVGNTFHYGLLNSAIVAPAQSLISIAYTNRARGNSWELPVIGKYYFRRSSPWQPFAGMGYAFRDTIIDTAISQTTLDPSGVSHLSSYKNSQWSGIGVGAVFSGGVRFHAGRFAIAPEARYTRWGSADSVRQKSEAALLVGISF